MPMTTPSTVRPERNLFLASVRREMTSRSKSSTALPRHEQVFRPGDDCLAVVQVAFEHFRELIVDQPKRDGHGPQQQRPVLHPHMPGLAVAGLFALLLGSALGCRLPGGWR